MAQQECHSLWIGLKLPVWVVRCMESYLHTGHTVCWWLYQQEERADLKSVVPESMLQHPNLHIRDANEICQYKQAQMFYFHGMGPEGKWAGWAPFSDWFRYEVISRFGGWWIDADGINVRQLYALNADVPVIATERHRRDRRSLGAVAVPFPGQSDEPIAAVGSTCESNAEYRAWIRAVDDAGLDLCLVTNNHFFLPAAGSPMMKELAFEMLQCLKKYAQQLKQHGVSGVQQVDQSGRTVSAIPTGLLGMELFQRKIREAIKSSASAKPLVLHWSVFNPVEAIEPDRMRRVLQGAEKLRGKWIRTIHLFRQIRDHWGANGTPGSFHVVTTDEEEVPESYKRKASVRDQTSLLENEVYVEVARQVGRPLLKRPRRDAAI